MIGIWDYTAEEWSEAQAEKYFELIITTCDDLAQNPKLGRTYDGIYRGLRGFKCGEHIVFNRKKKTDSIEIVRILHGKMDLKSRL
ncbi:MAG: type II toxin-antitoxin system RelE/ParE family toxin [Flavobacteriales bacterium]